MQYLFDFLVIVNVVFKISFTIIFSQTRNNEKKVLTTFSKKKATFNKKKIIFNKKKHLLKRKVHLLKKTIFNKEVFVVNALKNNSFFFRYDLSRLNR